MPPEVTAPPGPATRGPTVDPVQEVRFAVVIYGGVSLAVYINGIAQEMLRMVRATAAAAPSSTAALVEAPRSTERVYRKLGQIIGDLSRTPAQVHASLADDDPILTRFVIDILSGTSAGGINAMFLAKALANNQSIDKLQELWVSEFDVGVLINDKLSLDDANRRLDPQRPPRALLNGQRMYLKLLEALDGMDATPRTSPSPLVDNLDLFSTTTDIAGLTLPIALADAVVDERRHRNVFHFRYPSPESSDGTDFALQDNPFLAFAARCTSAFPIAFEPMAFSDVFPIVRRAGAHRHAAYCDPQTTQWQRYYTEYLGGDNPDRFRVAFDQRAFGDGGYLDNKPFSYAIDTMLTRHAELPVARKLVYVEPNPEHLRALTPAAQPDAIDNAIAALITLPRYETIREDLERVVERNVRVERLQHVVDDIEAYLAAPESGAVPDQWLSGVQSAQQFGGGYVMYERLKLLSVADTLVDMVTEALAIDVKSGYASAMRLLAAVWRNSRYASEPERRQFLLDFDVAYRLRRLRYLRRRINEWAAIGANPTLLRQELKSIKRILKRPHDALQALVERPRRAADFPAGAALFPPEELKLVLEPPRRVADWPGLEAYPFALEASPRGQEQRAGYVVSQRGRGASIDAVAAALKAEFVPVFKQASADAKAAFENVPGLTPEASQARARVRDAYKAFEAHDSALFPIAFGTDLGEGETIDIVRISPDDAVARRDDVPIAGSKVKGQALGAFAGFLDRTWRENDILWGRLDGAERLISILLSGRDDETAALRRQLIDEAHAAIVDDALPLKEGASVDWRQRLADFVAGTVRKHPEPTLLARSAARATAVAGALLEGIAEQRQLSRRPFAYVALAGRIAWEFVEVAAPRSFSEIVFVYWLQVLLVSASLVTLAGLVIGEPPLRSLGGSAIVVLLAIYFVRRALRRLLSGRSLLTAATLSTATVLASVAFAALLAAARQLVSGASPATTWVPSMAAARDVAVAAFAQAGRRFTYLAWSALICSVVTGWIAARFAARIEPPPGDAPRRPMFALEFASTWRQARAILGGDGHLARDQVQRAVVADYPFIAAYTLLFVTIGATAISAGRALGWPLSLIALVAGGTDLLENAAIAALVQRPVPRPFDPAAPLDRAPRPYAIVKWIAIVVATILAAGLVAT
jgi:patatin-related protein